MVSLDPLDSLDLLVLLDPSDQSALLADTETVVKPDPLVLLAPLDLLEQEVHLDLLDLVVRRVLQEREVKGA